MTDGDDADGAADAAAAVEEFLDAADRVLGEYDQGYMDADAALDRLSGSIDDLRAAVDGGDGGGGGEVDATSG